LPVSIVTKEKENPIFQTFRYIYHFIYTVNKSLNNKTSYDIDYMYPRNALTISLVVVSDASDAI
jgi:hypothetical protein